MIGRDKHSNKSKWAVQSWLPTKIFFLDFFHMNSINVLICKCLVVFLLQNNVFNCYNIASITYIALKKAVVQRGR